MPSYSLAGISVLVTGGAGFIGSHLVDALLASEAKVRVLDNFETGRRENLAHIADRIEVIEADIRDLDSCMRACAGVQYVLHQAALGSVPRSMAAPAKSLSVNVTGTANVFTAARDCEVKRVVYASSSSVYGSSNRLPKNLPPSVSSWLTKSARAWSRGKRDALYRRTPFPSGLTRNWLMYMSGASTCSWWASGISMSTDQGKIPTERMRP